jgi:uncharacterized protein with HEPN domain
VKYCENIEDFINAHGSDEESFSEDLVFQYGCAFSLIQIGQCVKDLSPGLKERFPEPDWKGVAGFRDKMATRLCIDQHLKVQAHGTELCSAADEQLQGHFG